MPQISIVVPVYNSAKYLSRTISSIQAQTYEDWEVLFIDDGSTDDSVEIIKQYIMDDNRIKLICQENAGPARARNVGMKNAQGRYLSFVDSDDTIEPNMLQCMYDTATKYHAHIVMCNYATILDNKRIESHHNFTCNTILSNTQLNSQVLMCYFNGKYSGVPSLWTKFIDLIWLRDKGIIIPENRIVGEDWLFNLQCIESNPRFCAIDDIFYNYWQNEGSIMHSVREDEWKQHFESMQILREVSQRHGFNCENNISTKYVSVLIEYMLGVYKQMPNRKDMIDEIINYPLYIKALHDANLSKLPKVFRIIAELQKRRFFKLSKFCMLLISMLY